MSITFNALEIFEMAEQIERNGAKFYRKAAQNISSQGISKMLLELAAMEENHEQTFANMRKQISYKERELITFDPENEASLYLQAMANGHVFDLKKDPCKQLKGKETVEDILKMAIEAEKDSIVFYLGLRDFVGFKAGKSKVEDIIREERGHIALLSRKLTALKK